MPESTTTPPTALKRFDFQDGDIVNEPTTPASDATEPITAGSRRASELFDEAVNNPARRGDAIGELFAGLAAAAQAASEQRRALKKARRDRPEAVAARKRAALRGWETRRRRAEEAREARARDVDDWPSRPGPRCDVMSHNSIGAEVFCYLEPGHHGDHEDGLGCDWPRGDWEEYDADEDDAAHE